MKKQTLGLFILVIFGILAIGLAVKHDKRVFVTGIHDSPYPLEKQGEIHFHGDDSDSGNFRILPSAIDDTTEYYWTAPATGVYETSSEQYLTLSVEDATACYWLFTAPDGDEITINKAEWSLSVKDTTPFVFSGFPQLVCDEIVYLGVETVVDTLWMIYVPYNKESYHQSFTYKTYDYSSEEDFINRYNAIAEILDTTYHTYLNLRINGTEYRIALEEIK